MSHNKGSVLPKLSFPTRMSDSRVLRGYCGAQVIYGPGPFTRRESKGPSRGGLWPKPDNMKHKIALGYSRGRFSPRQNLKSHRTEGQKRYRTKIERKIQNIKGKLPLLPFNTLNLTEPHSLAFTTTPNDFGYRLMGQLSVLERLTLHVDEGQ